MCVWRTRGSGGEGKERCAGESCRVPELHYAVVLPPPTRCSTQGRERGPTSHRYNYLIASLPRPFPKPGRTVPSDPCLPSRSLSPSPHPRSRDSLGGKRASLSEGRRARAARTEGLRARAGRPPCARRAPRGSPRRPPEGVPPPITPPPRQILELRRRQPTAPYLASITHLHTGASERASERERARGREEGRREEGGRGGERGEEEEERAEYTADIISTTVAEPYRTCFTAGGFKTSPVEQQPELQQPQDTVSLPLPPLPHATPDPFTLYSLYFTKLQAPSSLMESTIVQQVTRVVHSNCRFVCHPCTAVSSSTATTGKGITYQVTESAGGHLFLPQDLRWKSTGLGVFAVQSVYELARRHNASAFYSGPP
ncbi:uncharacterized protein LOC141566987 [Rhinolophus sinicus]|uniref:uncharacterized protein LOC141566987 n=1 Tax=Rhinolophus sinicus TaxID=89399 RepID=UPI003D7B0C46